MKRAIENSVKDILKLNIEDNNHKYKEKVDSNDVLHKIDIMKKEALDNGVNKKFSSINLKKTDLNLFENTSLITNDALKLKIKDQDKKLKKDYIESINNLNLSDRKKNSSKNALYEVVDATKKKNTNLDTIVENRVTHKNHSSKQKNKKSNKYVNKDNDVLCLHKKESSKSNSFKSDKSDSVKEKKDKSKTSNKFRSSQFIAHINFHKLEPTTTKTSKNLKVNKEITDIKPKKINHYQKKDSNDNRAFITPKNNNNSKYHKSVSNM